MITATPAQIDRREGGEHALSVRAMIYLTIAVATAAAATVPSLARLRSNPHNWRDFVILTVAAATAQLFVVTTTRNQSMHAALVFAIPATLVLPPGLIALMAVAMHVPEWLKERYPWFIQIFNISNWVVSALAAWLTAHVILHAGLVRDGQARHAI